MTRRGAAGSAGSIVRTLAASAAGTLVVLLLASMAVFGLVRLAPGDPVASELASSDASSYLSAGQIEELSAQRRAELGLDRPLPVQYVDWLAAVLRLDLGTSYRTGRPVVTEFAERLPASLALAGAAILLAIPAVVLLAGVAVRRPGGVVDQFVRLGTVTVAAVPSFLLGVVALTVAARSGYQVIGDATVSRVWLPAAVLAVAVTPTLARVLRASLLAEQGKPYAEAARNRGVAPAGLLFRHTLRPAATPVLTTAGLTLASLLAGSVITEVVFTWPGIAAYAVGAIKAQDQPVVQAYVLAMVVVALLVNRGVDLLQRLLDPRVEQSRQVVG
ncbi:MAG: ABC transporter permease [Micropruina sp.]|uniref:ABC transporter permease n=1 Tax=Micropruina sp. TaxID=2737536 RepID=UPI0039E4A3F5